MPYFRQPLRSLSLDITRRQGLRTARILLAPRSRQLDAAAPARLTLRMKEIKPTDNPAIFGRHLLRTLNRAALASSLRGAPYASLVLFVADLNASPLLLLSDLAQHSRN